MPDGQCCTECQSFRAADLSEQKQLSSSNVDWLIGVHKFFRLVITIVAHPTVNFDWDTYG